MILAAPAQAYVSYSFTGYADEDDPRFPEFTFYTNDFLAPAGNGDQLISIPFASWAYSQNVSKLSVAFQSNPYGDFGHSDGFEVTMRYAYPGNDLMWLNFDRSKLGAEGVYGNGKGLLTVAWFDGDIPAFTFVESDAGPFPGSTNNPIVGTTIQPGVPGGVGGVPEPGVWLTMIAGFGLIGAAVRRSRPLVTA